VVHLVAHRLNDLSGELASMGDPGDGNDAAYGYNLVRANQGGLATCHRAAARAGKDQGCNIIVRAQ
jgi:hypothetical protein